MENIFLDKVKDNTNVWI
ncbi:hypothetical protein Golob_025784 [Gossypium lobatum]|uniref:Uncharacterized protein n=1 Tax=Gossypium lobatum TaxID=34289 RepID=A0A7J8LT64_9ROSI|nr:hypothetical protein [Gossypium lobatum]